YRFFFQAEDGIRDATVTGVQTCALPIYQKRQAANPAKLADLLKCNRPVSRQAARAPGVSHHRRCDPETHHVSQRVELHSKFRVRSEERRVGKECRSWWSQIS